MWLFLDLVAAESLVVLMSSIFPNFVISLALVAFANGLWMSVGGFLVTPTILNPFWKYVFHYIDYQVRADPSPHHDPPLSSYWHTNKIYEIGIRLSRNDGKRIFPPQLLLRLVLPMHVSDRPCIAVSNSWHRRPAAIRIRRRSHRKMGWHSHWNYRCISVIWLDCTGFEAYLVL